jgi:hypothetical protein
VPLFLFTTTRPLFRGWNTKKSLIFERAQKILNTSQIIKNESLIANISFIFLNLCRGCGEIRLWAVEQCGRLAREPFYQGWSGAHEWPKLPVVRDAITSKGSIENKLIITPLEHKLNR